MKENVVSGFHFFMKLSVIHIWMMCQYNVLINRSNMFKITCTYWSMYIFSNFVAILDARQRSSSGLTRNQRPRRSRDGWTDDDAWRRGSTARWYRNTGRRIRTSPGTYRTRPKHRKWVHCTMRIYVLVRL